MNYHLSLSDLMLVDGFAEAYGRGFAYIKCFLYASGMDTGRKIEVSIVQHRNLRNQAVTCERFCGNERVDKGWLRSGAASLNAFIESSPDKGLQQDLKDMSKESATDRAFSGPLYEKIA